MKEKLEKIRQEALAKIAETNALDKLNDIRVSYLGKKGELTEVLKGMKDVAASFDFISSSFSSIIFLVSFTS